MGLLNCDDHITDDDYEEFCEFDEYFESLPPEQRAAEEKWYDSIALAISQGKNVVPNEYNKYDYRM